MPVLDASVLLSFLKGEEGSEEAEGLLSTGKVSAANWSEVAQKIKFFGGDWAVTESLLKDYGLEVVPVLEEDAVYAADIWRKGAGLSLGDRLCLALGARLGDIVVTADRAWGQSEGVRQLRG